MKAILSALWEFAAVATLIILSAAIPVLLVRLIYRTYHIRRSAQTVGDLVHYVERERWHKKRDHANDSYDTAYGWGGSVTIHHKAYTWVQEKWTECTYSYTVDGNVYFLEVRQDVDPPRKLDIFYRKDKPAKSSDRESYVGALLRLIGYLVIYTVVNAIGKWVIFYPLFFVILGVILAYIFVSFWKVRKPPVR